MFNTIKQLLSLLTRRERWQLGLLFVAIVVMAGLQVVSIAAIWPFLSVAADPGAINDYGALAWAYEAFGFESAYGFTVALGIAAFVVLVLSNGFIIATTWAKKRWINMRNYTLSTRLLAHYLRQPYTYFLSRNSSDLGTLVLAEVKEVVGGLMLPGLQALAQGIVALTLMAFLVAVDPLLAVIAVVVLGGAYGTLYVGVRRWLARIGQDRVRANKERYQATGEAFGGIKEVKTLGREDRFVQRYKSPAYDFARHRTSMSVVRSVPKYAFEAIAFGGLLLIALYLYTAGAGMRSAIPMLGVYAFGAYRLMPALQQMFKGVTSFKFNAPALEAIHEAFREDDDPARRTALTTNGVAPAALGERLELDGVTFHYPGDDEPTLRDISCVIEARTTVGIVGPTGAGKTTLVDIILGLLRPQEGQIRVDGVPLTDANIRAWQRAIGYVPQDIYLSDTSVARNIAFGELEEDIDRAAVERAARIANIHDFITGTLPHGYDTVVGERGVRLSGGQRQRIGIARALYHDPDVLVFDEATSAVDTDTERGIMDAVYRLAGKKTIIMIAHRTKTLERCDKILRIEMGRLVGEQSYQEMPETA